MLGSKNENREEASNDRLPSIHKQFNSSEQLLTKGKLLPNSDSLKIDRRRDGKVHSVGKMEDSTLKLPPIKRS